MAHDVFISYAVEDTATASAARAALEASRIRCWFAPQDVVPGMDYAEAIVEAIGQSRVMILIFSSHSNHSPHVRREVELAVSAGVPILPFRTEDVPLSPSLRYFIGTVHWLDALTPPLEKHLQDLARTAKLLLRTTKREQVAVQADVRQPAGAADTAMDKERYEPAPSGAWAAAKRWAGSPFAAVAAACGTAKRWAGSPLAAVAAACGTAKRWAGRPVAALAGAYEAAKPWTSRPFTRLAAVSAAVSAAVLVVAIRSCRHCSPGAGRAAR